MNNTKLTRHARDLVKDINWVLPLLEDSLRNYQLPESILTLTDELFITFWHYFQNILVMLVETIPSRKMELVLLDGEMDIFNYSFTQKENILILSVMIEPCSVQNRI